MINYIYYPKNLPLDEVSKKVVNAFTMAAEDIDSTKYKDYPSNKVLSVLRPKLEEIGFRVEKSKSKEDRIEVPVLYGLNGKIEKYFLADAYLETNGYVIEVEAGRAIDNNQVLKDFIEACTMIKVDRLCIAVKNFYQNSIKKSNDFEKVCTLFDSIYASNRLGIPLTGLLIIGY